MFSRLPRPRPADVTIAVAALAVITGTLAHGAMPESARRDSAGESVRAVWRYPAVSPDSLAAAERRLRERDPFAVEAGAGLAAQVMAGPIRQEVPRPPVSAVRLHAVAGPPWTAVISGVGQSGNQVVLGIGDTLGGLRVRTIRGDTLRLDTGDSVVTLLISRPPQ